MKVFVKRVLLFVAIVLIAFCFLAALNYLVYKSADLVPEKDKHVLILGDSNIQAAINDSIYTSGISRAVSAESYFYAYLKLKEILSSSSHIDTVLLSFAPHNMFDNGWLLSREHIYSNFRLYYHIMDWSDFKFLFERKPRAIIASVPSIGKQALENVVKKMIGRDIAQSYGGFIGSDRGILEEVQQKLINGEKLPFFRIPESFVISPEEEIYLKKIISLCESNNIKLYLINLPKRTELLAYSRYGVDNFNRLYDEKYSHIEFLDFSTLEMPDDYYDDFVHLTWKGSTYFSLLLENEGLEELSYKFNRHSTGTSF
jgi:hypothetical protein